MVSNNNNNNDMEYENDGDTNWDWWTWYDPQRLDNIAGRFRNQTTIQTTALLRSVRILRRVLDTRGDLLPT